MAEPAGAKVMRKLNELRVIDLKNELEKRGLDKNGVKQTLYETLKTALVGEGHNPETYSFEIITTTPAKASKQEKVEKTQDNEGSDSSNQITIGFDDDFSEAPAQKGNSSELNETTEQGNKNEAVQKNTPTTEKKNELDVPSTSSSSVNLENHIIIASTSTTTVSGNETSTTATAPSHKLQPSHSENNVIDIGMDHSDVIDSSSAHDKLQVAQENAPSNRNATQANEGTNDKSSTMNKTNQPAKNIVKISTEGFNLWVSGLSATTRAADLKNLFSKHGKVTGAKVVTNAKSPGSKCYGFVSMSCAEDLERSIKSLNRTELHGRIISVEKAKTDPSVSSVINKKPAVQAATEKIVSPVKEAAVVSKPAEVKRDEKKDVAKPGEAFKRPDTRRPYSRVVGKFRGGFRRNAPVRRPPPRFNMPRRDIKILTLDKIREERERERQREVERLIRQEERKQEMMLVREKERQREVECMQREEAARLMREKEKLRLEKQKLEYDKIVAERERISLEREKQRREREKLEKEREERKRELLRHQTERKSSKVDDWRDKRKSSFSSSMRGGADKSRRQEENKSRHYESRVNRDSSKNRKHDESRLEWRSVAKTDNLASSRSSRDMMVPQSNYHMPMSSWPPNTRSQVPVWNSSTPSFNTNYMPTSTHTTSYDLSRLTSSRYEPYKSSRRY